MIKLLSHYFVILLFCISTNASHADGKILATSGLLQMEGSAGGGIVPWSVIAGYGSANEWGAALAATNIRVNDFELAVYALALGIDNHWELSVAQQRLTVKPLNIEIDQDIISGKLRLIGDVIYNQWPQVSLGIQYKQNRDNAVPFALGAAKDDGVDYYLSATKLLVGGFWGHNLLLNGSLRATKANQAGLLGFGDKSDSSYDLVVEFSVAVFINRYWALGAEYRQKPDRLAAVKEDDWKDIFVGYFPNKQLALVLAYSDLGDIAGLEDQSGLYFSLQLSH